MRHGLSPTYVDIYRAPTFIHGLRMKAAMMSARLFGYWESPREDAAASFEEATFADEAYALYTNQRPVVTPEKKVSEILFLRDKAAVKLPNGFTSETSVTIGAAGDLYPADELELSKDMFFESVADILFDMNISFANLESPVTEQKVEAKFVGGTVPIMGFSIPQFSTVAGHKGRYFTALSLANNHTLDRGMEGLETTQRLLAQYGIMDVGTPRDPQEYGRAKILIKNGIKIGFISATYSLNGLQLPDSEVYRIHTAKLCSKYAAADLDLLKTQIADCKAQACDFIVASLHWGWEYEFFPRHKQIEAAHTLVEEGVDLILGHHPHVVQPVEYYCTKRDPNRVAVIAYGLGSLGMRWYTAPHLVLGMIVNMRLSKGHLGGIHRTYIESIEPIPVFQSAFLSYHGDKKLKRIEKLHDHLNDRGSNRSTRYLAQIKEYADLVLRNSIT